MLKKVFGILRPYLAVFILAILSLISAKAIEAYSIKELLPQLFDEGLVARNFSTAKFLPITILIALVLRTIFGFTTKFMVGYLTKSVAKDLRAKILEHMLYLPVGFFKQHPTGNLISKVNYDVEQINRALSDAILELLSSVITIMFLVGVMVDISWRLSVITLFIVPLLAWFLRVINIKIRKYSTRLQQSFGDVSHLAHELIDACKVIKIFEAIHNETKRIGQIIGYNFRQELKVVLVSSLSDSIMLIIPGCVIVVLIYIAIGNNSLAISPGNFMSFFTAMYSLMRPLKQLSEVNYVLARGLAAAESIFTLLESPIEHNKYSNFKDQSIDLSKPVTISFEQVNFNYANQQQLNINEQEQKNILTDINLTFVAGKKTAIVGKSGSGKSTLIGLLPRFYQATSGMIYLNGVDINTMDLHQLRKYFAMVSQRVVLLNDTVANNIAYGCMRAATREQIIAAAEAANAMEFISSLPNGLDTQIGNSGNSLSGGERQRIAIARAVLKNAPVLILDEATSALDAQSEQKIQTALDKLMQNKTTIVIAHRLSTIENSDHIVVIENGKLVASGTHRQLSQDLYYTNLHNLAINGAL
jgi:subfamily B ATP-binding cassette protein MsbA